MKTMNITPVVPVDILPNADVMKDVWKDFTADNDGDLRHTEVEFRNWLLWYIKTGADSEDMDTSNLVDLDLVVEYPGGYYEHIDDYLGVDNKGFINLKTGSPIQTLIDEGIDDGIASILEGIEYQALDFADHYVADAFFFDDEVDEEAVSVITQEIAEGIRLAF